MSCNTCSKEFGLLTKEHGCPNCGFSFCSKCLKWSVVVPKLAKTKKVCSRCYDGLAKLDNKPSTADTEAPAALQKPVDMLNTNGSGPSLLKCSDSGPPIEEIEKRLHRLRQDSKEVIPAHAEIEVRLAELRGVDVSYYRQPPITVYTDRRSIAEKASALMQQVANEVKIDTERSKSIKRSTREIEQRLASLRGTQPPQERKRKEAPECTIDIGNQVGELPCGVKEEGTDEVQQLIDREITAAKQGIEELKQDRELMAEFRKMSLGTKVPGKVRETKTHDEDQEIKEEEEADAVLQQVLAESAMEDQEMEELGTSPRKQVTSKDKELPWCVICNEDAALRCHDCTGDLYCRQCFKEYHDSEVHRTSPFKA